MCYVIDENPLPPSLSTQDVYYYTLIISHGSSSEVMNSLNPESIPHCEVYNFSVATTYFGTTYSGSNCGISDVILDTFLDGNNSWTEIKFLGELILNITVNVEVVNMYASQKLHDMQCISLQKGCTRMTYTLEPSQRTLTLLTETFNYNETQQKYASVYKFSLPILQTMEGSASSGIKLCEYKSLC